MRTVLLFVLVGILSACTHLSPRKPTGLTAGAFWKAQAEKNLRLSSILAKLRLRYETRNEGISGKGRLVTHLPRNLLLELRDPLGRVQYLVALENENFLAYYPSQKKVYVDTQEGKPYLKKFLGFSFSFRDLRALLVGVIPSPLVTNQFESWEWKEGEGVYRGKIQKGPLQATCDIDPDTAAIRTFSWVNGEETAKVTYEDFFPCCADASNGAFRLAGSVGVHLDKVNSRIEAEWEEVSQFEGKSPELFKVNLGPEVQRVVLP